MQKKQIKRKMYNILILNEYLSNRPIQNVLTRLNDSEKNDVTTLKFMCIVDYELERNDLYTQNSLSREQLRELLGFESYRSFVYDDRSKKSRFDAKNLRCSHCMVFGPCASILISKAISRTTNEKLNKTFDAVITKMFGADALCKFKREVSKLHSNLDN